MMCACDDVLCACDVHVHVCELLVIKVSLKNNSLKEVTKDLLWSI